MPGAVGKVDAVSNVEPTHAHVVRRVLAETHRLAGGEPIAIGEKAG